MIVTVITCVALTFTELLVLINFLEIFAEQRPFYKKHKVLAIMSIALILIFFAFFFDEQFYIKIITTILMYMITAKIVVETKTMVTCALAMIYFNSLAILETLVLLMNLKIGLLEGVKALLPGDDTMRVQLVITEIFVNVVLTTICHKKKGKLKEVVNLLGNKEWFSIFVISFISSIICCISAKESGMADNYNMELLMVLVETAIISLDVAILVLFIQSAKKQRNILESESILNRVKNETSLYRSLSDNLERQKKRGHEFNNQMNVIKGMLEQGKIQELQDYVSVIVEKERKYLPEINTNHVIINAIINTKYEETRQKDITFIMKVNDLSGITISDEDIVILLSNLLNNAIEACERTKEKMLKMKFVIEDNQIILSVKNSIADVPVKIEGEYISSKKDSEESHGIGLKNVTEVIEKYNGRYVIDFDEKMFSISTIIPL